MISAIQPDRRELDLTRLAGTDKFAYWHDVVCSLFSPSDNHPVDSEASFHAWCSHTKFGDIDVNEVKAAPTLSVRRTEHLQSRPLDDFFVSYLHAGQARVSQAGRDTLQKAGEFVLYDSARAFTYEELTDYEGIWIRLPRDTITSRSPGVEHMTARAFGGESAVGRFLLCVVEQAIKIDLPLDARPAARIGSSIADAITAALEVSFSGENADVGRQSLLLHRAKEYMRQHLSDPALDADQVARAVHVSSRTLNRMFATEGTTPIRWLWQRRLKASHDLLCQGKARQVTDAAVECGFSSLSHFSTSFRRTFGVEPRSLLRHRAE